MGPDHVRWLARTVLEERMGRIPCDSKANQLDLLDRLENSNVALERAAAGALYTYIASGYSEDWYPFVWLWTAAIPALAEGTVLPDPDPLRWNEEEF